MTHSNENPAPLAAPLAPAVLLLEESHISFLQVLTI